MTTNDCVPALPSGAAGCTEWELDGDELYRIVYTDEQRVDGCEHGCICLLSSIRMGRSAEIIRQKSTCISPVTAPCPAHNPVRWLRCCSTPPSKLTDGRRWNRVSKCKRSCALTCMDCKARGTDAF